MKEPPSSDPSFLGAKRQSQDGEQADERHPPNEPVGTALAFDCSGTARLLRRARLAHESEQQHDDRQREQRKLQNQRHAKVEVIA